MSTLRFGEIAWHMGGWISAHAIGHLAADAAAGIPTEIEERIGVLVRCLERLGWAYSGKDVCIPVFKRRPMFIRQNYTHKTGLFMLITLNPNVKKVL